MLFFKTSPATISLKKTTSFIGAIRNIAFAPTKTILLPFYTISSSTTDFLWFLIVDK